MSKYCAMSLETYQITFLQDWIYWSDWESEAIHRMNKFTGEEKSDIVTGIYSPMDIHIYHRYKQPEGKNIFKFFLFLY